MKRLFAAFLLMAASANAQDLGAFEKILFPVLSERALHGAYGAVVQTRLQASLSEPVAYYPLSRTVVRLLDFSRLGSILCEFLSPRHDQLDACCTSTARRFPDFVSSLSSTSQVLMVRSIEPPCPLFANETSNVGPRSSSV